MIKIKRFLETAILGIGLILIGPKDSCAQDLNNIERIDSLTRDLYGFSKGDCSSSCTLLETNIVARKVYEEQMNGLGSSIEYSYNSYVQGQINHMSYANCKHLKAVSQKTKTYFQLFEPILDKYGIPDELKYLAIIESGLKTQAVSRAGASGLWQFMPGTGKFLNMQVNSTIDERYHILMATEKACEYLLSMYNSFGDWSLALAAYNAGPGNVRKAISRSGGKRDFWKVQRFLPGETKKYVPRFMATVYLMEFVIPDLVDDCEADPKMLVQVKVNSNIHLKHAAAYLSVPIDDIVNYNPVYRTQVIDLNRSVNELFLPYDLAMKFGEMEGNIYALADSSISNNIPMQLVTRTIYHKAKYGEKMSSIAAMYNVSSYQIKKWNRMKNYRLYTGRRLKIRQKQLVCTNPSANQGVYSYVVEKGETVNSICRKIPSLDKTYILNQNLIETDIEVLEEGRIIEVHYGKVYAQN
jgi:membrane-bound lytic murein transglycosylase D